MNLRIVAGVAGGRVAEQTAFGPTVGGAAGIELGRWRVNLRYERLLNVVGSSRDVDSLFVTLGRSR